MFLMIVLVLARFEYFVRPSVKKNKVVLDLEKDRAVIRAISNSSNSTILKNIEILTTEDHRGGI
jgi:hypothetical protein